MSDDRAEFSVYVFLPDETHFPVLRWVHAGRAIKAAMKAIRLTEYLQSLTDDPNEQLVPSKVIVTDGGDNTVFLWQRGRGVVFPAHGTPAPHGTPA